MEKNHSLSRSWIVSCHGIAVKISYMAKLSATEDLSKNNVEKCKVFSDHSFLFVNLNSLDYLPIAINLFITCYFKPILKTTNCKIFLDHSLI